MIGLTWTLRDQRRKLIARVDSRGKVTTPGYPKEGSEGDYGAWPLDEGRLAAIELIAKVLDDEQLQKRLVRMHKQRKRIAKIEDDVEDTRTDADNAWHEAIDRLLLAAMKAIPEPPRRGARSPQPVRT